MPTTTDVRRMMAWLVWSVLLVAVLVPILFVILSVGPQ